MPASTFCHLSVFALLIQGYSLDGVDLAFRTELAQLLLHLHINKMPGEGNLRTLMTSSSLSLSPALATKTGISILVAPKTKNYNCRINKNKISKK
jgi:hypothetical protein